MLAWQGAPGGGSAGADREAPRCGSRRSTPQWLAQHRALIHARIACGIQQRHALPPGPLPQRLQQRCLCPQLRAVAPHELPPAFRIVVEPGTERRTRREIPEPCIQSRTFLADAARPETIDEHAMAIRALRRLVYPLERYAARLRRGDATLPPCGHERPFAKSCRDCPLAGCARSSLSRQRLKVRRPHSRRCFLARRGPRWGFRGPRDPSDLPGSARVLFGF